MANIERSDDPLPAYVQDTADAYDLVPGALAQRFKDERNIAREQLRGAVEERDRLASALEWAKRSNWIPTRAEVNVAREALGLPPLGGQQ